MGSLSVAILLLLHVGAEVDDLVCYPADASLPRGSGRASITPFDYPLITLP
jgi:hypothetical protein